MCCGADANKNLSMVKTSNSVIMIRLIAEYEAKAGLGRDKLT